jgi:hypothetical protein
MSDVARDMNGTFMIGSCKEIHFLVDPFMAEAYALQEGLLKIWGVASSLFNQITCRLLKQ